MRELFRQNRLIFNVGSAPSESAGASSEPEAPKKKTLADYGIIIEKPEEKEKDSNKTETSEKNKDGEPNIPERPKDALTGSQFGARLKVMEQELKKNMKLQGKSTAEISETLRLQREKAIYTEIKKGNIPAHLRKFKEVNLNYKNDKGETITGTIKVMPDYISIGSDDDHVRIPMTPYTAQLIARQWKCSLPTTKMVDAIAKQAKIKLTPDTKPANSRMMGTDYFLEHNKTVQEQLAKTNYEPGALVNGDKKDIVIPDMGEGSTHVVIYGWQKKNGENIQGYSHKAHENTYADYSHGVRLVSDYVKIEIRDKDGKLIRTENKSVSEVLGDKYRYFILNRKPIANSQTSYSKSPWSQEISGGEEPPEPETPKKSDIGIPIDKPNTTPTDQSTEETATPHSTVSTSRPRSAGGGQSYLTPPHTTSENTEQTTSPATSASPVISETPSEKRQLTGTLAPRIAADNPNKFKELNDPPPPINGKTVFIGDSINSKITNSKYLKDQGHEVYAKGGERTPWLLEQKIPKERQNFIKFENAVVLIGTNDIGMGGAETPKVILKRIKQIWKEIKDANRNINLYVCTIPPFGGYGKYTKNPKINERRIAINEGIRLASKEDPSLRLIDLCLPFEEGGLADTKDDNTASLASSVTWKGPKGDPVHPDKEVLARTYGRAMHSYENLFDKTTGIQKTPENFVQNEGFESQPEFNEQTKTYSYPPGTNNAMTVHINRSAEYDPNKPTRVVVFGLPAGNSISQTIGSADSKGDNWRYGIQHIGAQTRQLREESQNENIVVAYVQAPNKSLSEWLKKNEDTSITKKLLDSIKQETGAPNAQIDLSSHSAGGYMIRHFIENNETIPNSIKRISFLDSQNQLDIEKSGPKILEWLRADKDHHLTIIGYDDREALLDGKTFPGQGSSYFSIMKIMQFLEKNGATPPFDKATLQRRLRSDTHTSVQGMNGQINITMLHNPGNGHRIRHTETVEYNGFLYSETAGTPNGNNVQFQGPRYYKKYIQKGHTRVA